MNYVRRAAGALFGLLFAAALVAAQGPAPKQGTPPAKSTATPAKSSAPPAKTNVPPGKFTPAPAQSQAPPAKTNTPRAKMAAVAPAGEKSALQHRFAVQVGAFADRPRAEALLNDLTQLFQGRAWIQVEPLQKEGATLYRVRILAVTRDEARSFADRLRRERKIEAWITPLLPSTPPSQ